VPVSLSTNFRLNAIEYGLVMSGPRTDECDNYPDTGGKTDESADDAVAYIHGIRASIGQFSQQLLQVFFVGLIIGMQRNIVPALAEIEFGVPADSYT
jgi:hypothetical protein